MTKKGNKKCQLQQDSISGRQIRESDALHPYADDGSGSFFKKIAVDLQSIVYCHGVAQGEAENFEFVLQKYKATSGSVTQKSLLASALTCSRNGDKVNWLIANLMKPWELAKEHLSQILQGLASNSEFRTLVTKYLHENWQLVLTYTGTWYEVDEPEGRLIVAKNLKWMSTFQSTPQELDELKLLIGDIKLRNPKYYNLTQNILTASLTKIEENIKWVAKHADFLGTWFTNNVS